MNPSSLWVKIEPCDDWIYHSGIKDSVNKTLGILHTSKLQKGIFVKKTKMRAGEDAQHVNVLAVKPEDLSLIS